MVFEKVRAILSEQFDKSEEEILNDLGITRQKEYIFDDLEADSLDLADLLSSLEDEFDIEATDDVISSVSTVGDVVNYICEVTKLSQFKSRTDLGAVFL